MVLHGAVQKAIQDKDLLIPWSLYLTRRKEAKELTLVEFVELPREVHPYYVGTQAHPEFLSRPTKAHPLFSGLIAAAIG